MISEFWHNASIFAGTGFLVLSGFFYWKWVDPHAYGATRIFARFSRPRFAAVAAAIAGVIALSVAVLVPISKPSIVPVDPALIKLLADRLPPPALENRRHRELIAAIRDGHAEGHPAMSDLERLLAERLPAATETERRHRELMEAINRLPAPPPDTIPWQTLGYGISTAGLLAIAWLLRNNESRFWKRVGYFALVVGLLADIFQIAAGICDHWFAKPAVAAPQNIIFSTAQAATVAAPSAPQLRCHRDGDDWLIDPFSNRLITHFEDDAGDVRLKGRIANILNGLITDRQRISAFLLIGAADQQALRSQAVPIYRSNSDVAMRRAEAVAAEMEIQLRAKWRGIVPAIVELPRGAQYLGDTVEPSDQASDGSVQLCVAWK